MKHVCSMKKILCFCLCLSCVIQGKGADNEKQVASYADIVRARQYRAIEVLEKNSAQGAFANGMSTQQQEELLCATDDLFRQYVPQYCGRLVCETTGKEVSILFEKHVIQPYWSLSVFEGGKILLDDPYLVRFPFCSSHKVILNCGVTNCLGGSVPDALVVEVLPPYSGSGDEKPQRVYYAVSRYSRPMEIRQESEDGTPIYDLAFGSEMEGGVNHYYPLLHPPIEFFDANEDALKEDFLTNSVSSILNKFMVLNLPTPSCESDDHKNITLRLMSRDVLKLRSSASFSAIVAKLLKHNHPWVRQAANHYLVNYGKIESAEQQQHKGE